MRLSYDVGRLPRPILSKMSGRGITAQQEFYCHVCKTVPLESGEDSFKQVRCLAEACEVVLRDPMNEMKMMSPSYKDY